MKLGTRGSALALAQARLVAEAVTAATGERVDLVEISTAGDKSSAPVAGLGVGVFVSALRDALAAKEIDFAVHSYKDLPTAAVDGLTIAAVPPREDPREALVASGGRTLAELPRGARIGTGAPRRIAQLAALGLGFECVPIRGNVDTRLRKVRDGELDAVVLARAGIARLGRADEITEVLDPLLVLPAPAQGALAVECRTADTALVEALSALDDPFTRLAVVAERALLAELEAGCSAPVAALAEVAEGDDAADSPPGTYDGPGPAEPGTTYEIYLRGAALSHDGSFAVRLSGTGTLTAPATAAARAAAAEVGRRLAADLLANGADSVLGSAR